MKRISVVVLLLMSFFMAPAAGAAVYDFEELSLGSAGYWNGSDGSGMFTSKDAVFMNRYNSTYGSWDGWAYSNKTDSTTPGYSNQYSAVTGAGAGGSANYGVAYAPQPWSGDPNPPAPTISFGASTGEDYSSVISGAYFTNTTYAFLTMRDGDGWMVNPFEEGDWQMLTVKGITEAGYSDNIVEFYLADFTNGNSYILNEWTWVDLTSLGNVVGLEFSFSGSQATGVPSYVAMDNLNGASPVPVPAA